MRHSFHFKGGGELTTMGAVWFVSYMWYNIIDKAHENWNYVSTVNQRISTYNRTIHFHIFWLNQILQMNPSNLNKNTIGLNGHEVINMAKKLLECARNSFCT